MVGALAGVLPIDGGRITLGDDVLDDPSEQVFVGPEDRDIGIVFQDYLLFPHLTVADNVGFGLLASGLPKAEVAAMVDVWLERSGLTDISRKKARELSGGQAQQVAVARAIMSGPEDVGFGTSQWPPSTPPVVSRCVGGSRIISANSTALVC